MSAGQLAESLSHLRDALQRARLPLDLPGRIPGGNVPRWRGQAGVLVAARRRLGLTD